MTILLTLLAIIKKIPYQAWVLVGLVGLVWFYGNWQFQRGEASAYAEWEKAKERGKVILAEIKKRQLTVNMVVDTVFHERTEYVYVTSEAIIKEIPYYIPVSTPDLPGGFRVLHDAGVRSIVPPTTGSVEAAPVGVADATRTILSNYSTCHLDRAEVEAWRQWYQEQAQLWHLTYSK